MIKEREEAALEFLNKELKWRDEIIIDTKWFAKSQILWITLDD